jgi:outer membrane protein TolC
MKYQKVFITLIIYLLTFSIYAQSKVLDNYIQEAFANHEGLKQQSFILEKNLYALKEAQSLFYPQVNFLTNYTVANGGRTIDIPIGDLLNPVYATLNQLTNSNKFPQLENSNTLLNPHNFYDARFRTTYLIINAEIRYNQKIKKEMIEMQKLEVLAFKRELAKEVKFAYYKYWQASQAIIIYENVLKLLKESERVNQSLVNNGKALNTLVVRAKNEVLKVETQSIEAKNNQKNAAAYFNFLLNKSFDTPIILDTEFDNYQFPIAMDSTASNKREEYLKLKSASNIVKHQLDLNKSYKMPKLNLFLDAGSQAFDFEFNNKSIYYLGGVSLDIPIFAGEKNLHKIKQSELEWKSIESQSNLVDDQLQLQMTTSKRSYETSIAQYQSSLSQLNLSKEFYDDILKLYKEGQVLYIELLDAQNQYTNSQLQVSIAKSNVWMRWAEVERVMAVLNIE